MSVPSSAIGQFVIGQSPIQGTPPQTIRPLTTQIPAYPYWQYADDDNIQTLFDVANALTQYYLDWFTNTPLPIYTSSAISGPLLDWIAQGLYGISRPLLGSGFSRRIGAIDTDLINQLPIDGTLVISGGSFRIASDDIFKRILTWQLYEGDGKLFSTRWLKRRVARFLTGVNGVDGLSGTGVQNTYDVSVASATAGNGFGQFSFGVSSFGGIGIIIHIRNSSNYDANVLSALQEAVNSGVLELPFQYQFTVTF